MSELNDDDQSTLERLCSTYGYHDVLLGIVRWATSGEMGITRKSAIYGLRCSLTEIEQHKKPRTVRGAPDAAERMT